MGQVVGALGSLISALGRALGLFHLLLVASEILGDDGLEVDGDALCRLLCSPGCDAEDVHQDLGEEMLVYRFAVLGLPVFARPVRHAAA